MSQKIIAVIHKMDSIQHSQDDIIFVLRRLRFQDQNMYARLVGFATCMNNMGMLTNTTGNIMSAAEQIDTREHRPSASHNHQISKYYFAAYLDMVVHHINDNSEKLNALTCIAKTMMGVKNAVVAESGNNLYSRFAYTRMTTCDDVDSARNQLITELKQWNVFDNILCAMPQHKLR